MRRDTCSKRNMGSGIVKNFQRTTKHISVVQIGGGRRSEPRGMGRNSTSDHIAGEMYRCDQALYKIPPLLLLCVGECK